MENTFEIILKTFYKAAVANHSDFQRKIYKIDQCFSRIGEPEASKRQFIKIQRFMSQQTKSSLLVDQQNQADQKLLPRTSNMFFTFLQTKFQQNTSNYNINPEHFRRNHTFSSEYPLKVILYAIFINYLHINSQHKQKQNIRVHDLTGTQTFKILKKVKTAMVGAAYGFKVQDKKKYAKIRYLYEKLIKFIDHVNQPNVQEYVKLIIEQFSNDYIENVFQHLKIKNNELLYSLSMSYLPLDKCSEEKQEDTLSKFMNSLDYLNINLTILNEKSPVRNCKNNKKIQLILQKTKDSLFNLHSIIVEDDN